MAPTTAVEYRRVPTDMPSTIDHSTNTVSRVSRSTLRNRTTANTANRPKAIIRLPAISIMSSDTITGSTTSAPTNDRA